MSNNDSPITPPLELVQRLRFDAAHSSNNQLEYEERIAILAYQAGADQELEACAKWIVETIPSWAPHTLDEQLRAARRPKPPTLKEQALKAIGVPAKIRVIEHREQELIRRALEQLPD